MIPGASSRWDRRLPNPVLLTAAAIIRPPKTSHRAPEENPEKTTGAGATLEITAMSRKISAVRYSGNAPVAQKPMANMISAPALMASLLESPIKEMINNISEMVRIDRETTIRNLPMKIHRFWSNLF